MGREKSQRLSKTGLKVHKVEQDGNQQARGKKANQTIKILEKIIKARNKMDTYTTETYK